MTKSESIAALAAALAKAQAEIRPAAKDSENPHFRSKYADLASCWEACRDPLSRNGFAVVQSPGGDAQNPAWLTLETLLVHSSGEFISSTIGVELQKRDPQALGSALTYLRRYGLSAIVGLVADDDDDANSAMPAPGKRSAPAANKAPAAPPVNAPAPPAADPRREEYLERVRGALRRIHGDDKTKALAQVEALTTFTGKDGQQVAGVQNYTKLSDARLKILAHSLEKESPKPETETEPF